MRRTSVMGALALAVAVFATVAARANAESLGSSSTDISGANSRTQETSAGNLVADAVRDAGHADAAIIAADALTSASVAHGTISRADLKTLLDDPDDEVTTLSLTGGQLKTVLERSVSAHPKPFDGFLQLSGIRVVFGPNRVGGSRIVSVSVNGAALDANRRYRVATLNTLASGGLGYFKMWDEKDVSSSNQSVLDSLADYVRTQKTIGPHVEGRITAR